VLNWFQSAGTTAALESSERMMSKMQFTDGERFEIERN
jgi:hypothetical protein